MLFALKSPRNTLPNEKIMAGFLYLPSDKGNPHENVVRKATGLSPSRIG
jgi:hypothetical protein